MFANIPEKRKCTYMYDNEKSIQKKQYKVKLLFHYN